MEDLRIRPARPADATLLARLMTDAISWGRLAQLGPRFVTLLHRHMIGSRFAICRVAEKDGEVVGYTAVATDSARFYRDFLLRRGIVAALLLFPGLLRPGRLRVIWRGLSYFPEQDPDDPPEDFLSFAVRSDQAGAGIGRALMDDLFAEARRRGVTAFKASSADVNNRVANEYYRRLGGRVVRTVPFYADTRVNVYVFDVPPEAPS